MTLTLSLILLGAGITAIALEGTKTGVFLMAGAFSLAFVV